jgi:alpha-L-arabinofuranosidase
MPTSGTKNHLLQTVSQTVFLALSFVGFSMSAAFAAQTNTTTPTTINVSDTPLMTNAKRLGINLGSQTYWDSGIMMRNLTFRNPGFEGESWQSTIHCQTVTATSCTDDNLWTYWPADFLDGATASFIVGPAAGTVAKVTTSTAANLGVTGVTINLSGLTTAPSVGDYIVVRMEVPGNGVAGWWPATQGAATITTETTDLSPNTPGKQALSLSAPGANDRAWLKNFNDGADGRSFVQLKGAYTLNFRAKGLSGNNNIAIDFTRNLNSGAQTTFLNKTITVSNTWQDYSIPFTANDIGQPGVLSLVFTINGATVLMDDVALTEAAGPNNPTAYRDAVVSALQALHPGVLRYMDSGNNWGSSIDNLLVPDFQRERAGYNNHGSEADDIAMGLHDFLVLCQTIGAEPWFTMPTGMTTQEMSNLMDYLGGTTATAYGQRRANLGQTAPWTSVFSTIHLEFGNEVWNTGNPGANMTDPAAYGKRAAVIFTTAKASPSYSAKSFDLILDGFQALPSWNATALANSTNYDTVDIASYNFANFNDASSTEAIFGPMLAEPEAWDSNPSGITALQAATAASATHPAKLAIYETNIGATQGATSQDQVQSAIPSLGAGLSVAANMLLMQRDLGVNLQNMFALQGFSTAFYPSTSSGATTTPIWGVTVDMGGTSNLRRPMYLVEQLANSAILPTLFATSQTGANPTWNQAYTTNDNFSLNGAHYIQSFAYSDGTTLNLILLNLSRTSALPVNFAGLNAPLGPAQISTLTGPAITANNETQTNIAIATTTQTLAANTVMTLPAYSMTVVSVAAPVVPVMVLGVKSSCANSSLSPTQTTNCTAVVSGQGAYNSSVSWSTTAGTISSAGVYTAPTTLPASGTAVITATAVGDTTKSSSVTLTLAPDTVTSVTASCPATTIAQGNNLTCQATIKGTGGYSPAITWSVSGGSITSNGILTAPVTGNSVTVTATSVQDPTKSSTVTLAVSPVLTMTHPVTSVTSTSITVNWTLSMPAYSGISYGLTTAAGNNTPYSSSTTQSPSFTLTGLQPGTAYYMNVFSWNTGQAIGQQMWVTTAAANSTITSVTASCPSGTLISGGTTTCAATVKGTGSYSSAVTWSASAGSITPAGVLTAPSSGTSVTVTATSTQDPTKSSSVVVPVTPSATISSISVVCGTGSVLAGGTVACTAPVTGTGSFSSAVTWSTSGGVITSNGVLTAPTTGAAVTVTATSVQNTAKSASAVVSITPLATITGVSVVCQATTVVAGATTNCASTVTGTSNFSSGVTWSATGGSITPAGLVTAPTTGTSMTVKATSTQDTTKYGVVTLTVQPALAITSNPVATVTQTSITVSWTVNNAQAHSGLLYGPTPALGGVTPYDPNATATPSYTITGLTPGTTENIEVTSFVGTQSVTKSLTATTTAAPVVSNVLVNCPSTSLVAGNNTTCSASVTGKGSYSSSVIWTASTGTVSPAGVLTVPSSITSPTTVVLTATSTQDPTKSASTTVSVTPAPTVTAVKATCPMGGVFAGGSIGCSAAVTGTGAYSSAVTWTASAGSITPAGVLTAPATGSSVTVTATSVQDATKSSSVTLSLQQSLAIVNLVVSATPTTYVVSWSVNGATASGIRHDTGPGTAWVEDRSNSNTTSPSFTVTGLTPGTTYHGQVYSLNAAGTAVQNFSVTTPLN